MKSTIHLACLVSLFVICSCSTSSSVGNKFQPENIQKLIPGKTSLGDAKKILGEPYSVVSIEKTGNKMYSWFFSEYSNSLFGKSHGEMQQVYVLFDSSGLMVKVLSSASIPPN